ITASPRLILYEIGHLRSFQGGIMARWCGMAQRSLRCVNINVKQELHQPVYMDFSKRAEESPKLFYRVHADSPGSSGEKTDACLGDDWGQGFDAEFWCSIGGGGWNGWVRF